jgi:protein-S-isoprenylcysteine O-methyltransferase Ste14
MALRAKKSVRTFRWRRQVLLRVLIIAVILLIHRLPFFDQAVRDVRGDVLISSPIAGPIGVLLCGLGFGLAFWARSRLGTNWGMPMSQKENPELVTSGPYAYVRHPIYSGILLAMIGSAVGESLVWVLPFVLSGIYLLYSARNEERLMIEQFPNQYPSYMRRTKMLIPFVL